MLAYRRQSKLTSNRRQRSSKQLPTAASLCLRSNTSVSIAVCCDVSLISASNRFGREAIDNHERLCCAALRVAVSPQPICTAAQPLSFAGRESEERGVTADVLSNRNAKRSPSLLICGLIQSELLFVLFVCLYFCLLKGTTVPVFLSVLFYNCSRRQV